MGRASGLLRRLRRDDGLTLVELIVASALSMIILLSVLSLLEGTTRAERATQARLDLGLDLRGAMTQLSKETRQALSIDASSTRSRLVMKTLVGGASHDVVYELSGTELRRTDPATGSSRVLVSRVTSTQPFCFDPPACSAVAPDSPTSVRITLSASPAASSGAAQTLQSDVELRNMR